jgi:hypothetical protein
VGDDQDDKFFRRVDGPGGEFPLLNPDQAFVVFSMSHVEFSPVCTDPRDPGIRIYACFATEQQAAAHALRISKEERCSAFVQSTHQWFLCPARPSSLEDQNDRVRERMDKYLETAEARDAEFDSLVEQQLTGGAGGGLVEKPTDLKRSCEEKTPASTFLTSNLHVPSQKFAVVSFVRDMTRSDVPEYLCLVYQCFGDDTVADQYVRNVVSPRVTEFDIDVVCTNEWLHPQYASGHSMNREEFRNPELNHVMQQKRGEQSKVDAFERTLE